MPQHQQRSYQGNDNDIRMKPTTRRHCPTLLRKVGRVLVFATLWGRLGGSVVGEYRVPILLVSSHRHDHSLNMTLGAAEAFSNSVNKNMPHCTLITPLPLVAQLWTTGLGKSLVASYDMPGIQWTYSIPGPIQGIGCGVASVKRHIENTLQTINTKTKCQK